MGQLRQLLCQRSVLLGSVQAPSQAKGQSFRGQSRLGVQITSGIRQPRQLLKPKVSPSGVIPGWKSPIMPGVQITSSILQPRQLLKPKVSLSGASSGSYSAKGKSYWGQSRQLLKPKVSPSGISPGWKGHIWVSPCWEFRSPAVFASPGRYSSQR